MPANSPAMIAGQAIERDQCSACHGIDGRGVATKQEPTAPSMPSFGWQLNDVQVAAVLTYIRNAWQTAAAPVSSEAVGKARDQLRTQSD